MNEYKNFIDNIFEGTVVSYKLNIDYRHIPNARITSTLSNSVIEGMKQYMGEEEFNFHDFKIIEQL